MISGESTSSAAGEKNMTRKQVREMLDSFEAEHGINRGQKPSYSNNGNGRDITEIYEREHSNTFTEGMDDLYERLIADGTLTREEVNQRKREHDEVKDRLGDTSIL